MCNPSSPKKQLPLPYAARFGTEAVLDEYATTLDYLSNEYDDTAEFDRQFDIDFREDNL